MPLGPRKPPVSRAQAPGRKTGPGATPQGRRARPAPPASGMTPRQRQAHNRRQREIIATSARAPGRAATAVTVRKGGQHALMAEFLLFCGIVALRAAADYVPASQGNPDEGTAKGTITPRSGQLGPLPILAAGFVLFFVLSFLAARGGTWARIAAVSGMIVDTALLLKSLPELDTVSKSFGNLTAAQAQAQAQAQPQVLPTPAGTLNPAADPGIYTQVPDATGSFPIITPNVPPVAIEAGQNPSVYTQP